VCGRLSKKAVVRGGCCTYLLYEPAVAPKNIVKIALTAPGSPDNQVAPALSFDYLLVTTISATAAAATASSATMRAVWAQPAWAARSISQTRLEIGLCPELP
jgi:hypothetical protein